MTHEYHGFRIEPYYWHTWRVFCPGEADVVYFAPWFETITEAKRAIDRWAPVPWGRTHGLH